MAREVVSGQTAVSQQYELQIEHPRVEQAAQADRANSMLHGADRHIASREGMVKGAKAKTE